MSSMKWFFCFFLFSVTTLKAQTNVSGLVSTNTTWGISGSPYIVTGNVLVQPGVRLTIEPGVQVKFNTGKALEIQGELIAIGNVSNRIVFTSNTTFTNGAWLKIQFSDSSVDAVTDMADNYIFGSALQYCDILYGGGGSTGTGAVNINSSLPFISNCTILRSGGDGIHIDGSDPNITSCNIRYCNGKGIYFEATYRFDCVLKIENDSIENNSMGGLFFEFENGLCSSAPVTYIRNNYFYNNLQHGAVWVEYGISHAIISENHFFNNSSSQGGALHILGINNTIQCNEFKNNQAAQGGALYLFNTDYAEHTYIQNNIFQGNQSAHSAAVFLNYIVANIPLCDVTFSDNVLFNNISSGTIISIKGNTGLGIGNVNSNFHILQNEFYNNQASSTLNLSYFKGEVSNNNFINPGADYEIYNGNTSGAPTVVADNNYWGTTGTSHIDSVIYDYFDNANQTNVSYSPVLSVPASADVSCLPPIVTGIHPEPALKINSFVFPNPFSASAEIKFGRELINGSVIIYDLYGRSVRTIQKINSDQIKINRDNLKEGIYIYEIVENAKKVATGKLVIN